MNDGVFIFVLLAPLILCVCGIGMAGTARLTGNYYPDISNYKVFLLVLFWPFTLPYMYIIAAYMAGRRE